jgi:DNA-binding NtrC family response regulator
LKAISVTETYEICPDVISLIERHPWPGNIRQLINVIRSTLYSASSAFISIQDLPLDFMAELRLIEGDWQSADNIQSIITIPLAPDESIKSLSNWELHGIKTALKESEGNITVAAKRLGITRSTLYKKLDYFRLDKMGEGILA